ncbi:MAG: secondary thiamine-phosphate synthase enzyme YjbQ [Firmicutes bacterium]|nr:secondary thiamine-phosphate synthase enzyme YjbQ [Bacillota bacterium]
MHRITLSTHRREEMIDITNQVAALVAEAKISQGIVVVQSPHTTLGVTVNEHADPDVTQDMMRHLTHLVPPSESFRHAEGNSDSHIKTSLVGPSVSLIIDQGRLQLGTWQGIFACEFDGPRRRTLWVQIVPALLAP